MSKRLVKDYMTSNKLKPHTVEITSQMRAHCRRARQRYHQHLEEQKKNAEKLSVETAKEVMTNEINELQDKIDKIPKNIKSLDEKFVEVVKNAEMSKDVQQMVAEANALKRKSEKQAGDKGELEESLDLVKVKRSKL